MTELTRWQDITPQRAADEKINLAERLDITAPHNEEGERCPWPWEPQQLVDVPLGQYHCNYCGAMVLAGMAHLDYDEQAGADAFTAQRTAPDVVQAARKARMQDEGTPYYECPDCHFVSPNPNDIENQYCARCHQFKDAGNEPLPTDEDYAAAAQWAETATFDPEDPTIERGAAAAASGRALLPPGAPNAAT